MKKFFHFILTGIMTFALLTPTLFVSASSITDNLNRAGQEPFGTTVETVQTPGQFIGQLIMIVLGFVGVIALILFLYGGFLYLTARGNGGQVETAQQYIYNAIIGIIIISVAYALTFTVTRFVFEASTR